MQIRKSKPENQKIENAINASDLKEMGVNFGRLMNFHLLLQLALLSTMLIHRQRKGANAPS